MGWFRRLGLQRRIMLYVCIGLALMFTIGAYGGLVAIHQATELVYQERLGTAFTISATLEDNLQHLAHHVESIGGRLSKANSPQQFQEIAEGILAQVSATSAFPLVQAASVALMDREGHVWSAPAGSNAAAQNALRVSDLTTFRRPSLLPPRASSQELSFGTLVVPVKDDAGVLRWTAIVPLAALNRDEPYLLPPATTPQGAATSQKPPNSYGLEVMGPQGQVVLSRKGGTAPGKVSPHWGILQQEAPQTRGPFVFLHRPKKGQKFAPHVIAAVPLSSDPYVVVLEQPEDVALALPLRLRQRLILFASLGFVVTLMVAWVTTRHVVKPTERLTIAAQRIAEGKVETPITVMAQDEIGILAESLETMRVRLQAWGSELEKQVRERTSQLEERNRELRVLYETLQKNREQLRALLGKVLGAQEEERRRVSRELHDGIGQALSALSMGLERVEHVGPDQQARRQEQIEALKRLATDTLGDLRRLTIALRPAALDDLGLVPAIRRYAELYLGNAGVDFVIQEEGLDTRLDLSLETVVYRVVQEAISNVARHSGATRVNVLLQSLGGLLTVTVEDNGHGFDFTLVASKRGVGLQGMEERASLVGGRLTVDSQLGRGTTVSLEIPLAERAKTPGNA